MIRVKMIKYTVLLAAALLGLIQAAAITDPEQRSGFHSVGDHVYYINEQIEVPWVEAASWCNGIDMKLVSMNVQFKNEQLGLYLWQNNLTTFFWTSGLRISDKDWLWTGNGEIVTFTSWIPGQPNLPQDEPCVAISYLASDWVDGQCSAHNNFICEFDEL